MVLPVLGGILGAGLLSGAALHGWAIPKAEQMRGKRLEGILADLEPNASIDDQMRAMAVGGLLSARDYAAMGFGDAAAERDFGFDMNLATHQYDLMDRNNANQAGRNFDYGQRNTQQQYDLMDRNNANQAGRNVLDSMGGSGFGSYGLGLSGPVFGDALSNASYAISNMESGGDYSALGPVTDRGDRAYGKYQVMGANIPSWTKKHLGTQLTPEEFLANPQAQETVFKGEFGSLMQQHGFENAASIWHSGIPLQQAAEQARHDGNMSTVDYVRSVSGDLGNYAQGSEHLRAAGSAENQAKLASEDAAAPYQAVNDKAQQVIDGVDNLYRAGNNVLNTPEGLAQVDQMKLAAEELFFQWKEQVYGEAEPPKQVLDHMRTIFRTPGGALENRDRTLRFFTMMQAEARKMGEYRRVRSLVETGYAPMQALDGMNRGYLTATERQSILGEGLPPEAGKRGSLSDLSSGDQGITYGADGNGLMVPQGAN